MNVYEPFACKFLSTNDLLCVCVCVEGGGVYLKKKKEDPLVKGQL